MAALIAGAAWLSLQFGMAANLLAFACASALFAITMFSNGFESSKKQGGPDFIFLDLLR